MKPPMIISVRTITSLGDSYPRYTVTRPYMGSYRRATYYTLPVMHEIIARWDGPVKIRVKR